MSRNLSKIISTLDTVLIKQRKQIDSLIQINKNLDSTIDILKTDTLILQMQLKNFRDSNFILDSLVNKYSGKIDSLIMVILSLNKYKDFFTNTNDSTLVGTSKKRKMIREELDKLLDNYKDTIRDLKIKTVKLESDNEILKQIIKNKDIMIKILESTIKDLKKTEKIQVNSALIDTMLIRIDILRILSDSIIHILASVNPSTSNHPESPLNKRTYSVYYSENQCNLSKSQEFYLDSIFTKPIIDSCVKINIVGYADSSGSEEYNLKLSELRARAVMLYLYKKGLNLEVFSIYYFGKLINPKYKKVDLEYFIKK